MSTSIRSKSPPPGDLLLSGRIRKTPGVCGGDACVRDTRITVPGLVEWRRLGLSDSEIIHRVSGLEPDDLAAAWAYAEQHPDEIDPTMTDAAA